MTNIKLLRDSPSQDAFEEREAKLVDSTKELFVRPGQVQKPVSFHDYYEKNWKHCAFRWVFAFRKNLPTKGANDTQAAESTFRALKQKIKKITCPHCTVLVHQPCYDKSGCVCQS